MARPVTLFTGQWADLPFETIAEKAKSFGYDGLELACWGDHFEVDRALSEDGYIQSRVDVLEQHGLSCFSISNHLVGQCVAEATIDARHRDILPDRLWGDGSTDGVRERCAEEMKDTCARRQSLRRRCRQWLHRQPGLAHDLSLPADFGRNDRRRLPRIRRPLAARA